MALYASPNSRLFIARCLTELFPQLRGTSQAPVRPLSVEAIAESGAGTAFLATPHEASSEIAPQLIEVGLRVVDLSGAFRFRDAETLHDVGDRAVGVHEGAHRNTVCEPRRFLFDLGPGCG
jgi:N-acetyl-gamma-glutamyl-phosphate reductase